MHQPDKSISRHFTGEIKNKNQINQKTKSIN